MFEGEPRPPKFQVGQRVYLTETAPIPIGSPGNDSATRLTTGVSLPSPYSLAAPRLAEQISTQRGVTVSSNLRSNTVYRIVEIDESKSDTKSHSYVLEAENPLRITTAEEHVLGVKWKAGDDVVKVDRRRDVAIVYQVVDTVVTQGISGIVAEKVKIVDEIGFSEWVDAGNLEKLPQDMYQHRW